MMMRFYKLCAPFLVPVLLVSCATGPPVLTIEDIRSTPAGRVVELPAGFKIKTSLDTVLSSTGSRVGDKCSVHTTEPVLLGDKVFIPHGSRIYGTVTEITPPKAGLLKAKVKLGFDQIAIGASSHPFPAKTTMDMDALVKKGGQAGGEFAAKKIIKYFIPIMNVVFLIQDINKASDYVQEDKEITLQRGTPFVVKLMEPVLLPYR